MYGMIIKLEINYDTHYIPNCEKSRKSVDVTAYLQEFIYKTSLFLNDERKENREIGKWERTRKICDILVSNYVVDRLQITTLSAGRAINAGENGAKAGAKMCGVAEVGLINF